MGLYFDRQGNSVDSTTWATLFEDFEGRRIAQTAIGDLFVSTVWLGIDQSFGGFGEDTAPLIFETMVFAEGSWMDKHCERYVTEVDAIIGHHRMVQAMAALFPSDAELQKAAKSAQAILRDLEL